MRRALVSAVLVSAIAVTGLVGVAPAQAVTGGPIDDTAFGMHVPQIANGVTGPAVNYGTLRLWDSGVAWGQVEQKKGKYWWNGLDAAIGNANAQGKKIMYVLGSTPKWAASNTKQGTYPNKGAASNPKSIKDWKNWVTAVVKRHGNSIESYQIWNEANLTTFWQGTPKQMATLTQEAYKIIRKYDPSAKVVAASTTVRLQSAYKKFFPAYMKELKKLKWPIDVVSVHLYPASTGTPADRVKYIKQVKADMKTSKVPGQQAAVGHRDQLRHRRPRLGQPRQEHRGSDRGGLGRPDLPRRRPLRRRSRLLVLLVPERRPRRDPDVRRHHRRPGLPDDAQLAQRCASTPAPRAP